MEMLKFVVGIVGLVCWIMMLIPTFKASKLHGFLCLLLWLPSCTLYPFIYGWIKVKQLKIETIMMVWSAALVIAIIRNILYPSEWDFSGQ